jgi:hypothetical protein
MGSNNAWDVSFPDNVVLELSFAIVVLKTDKNIKINNIKINVIVVMYADKEKDRTSINNICTILEIARKILSTPLEIWVISL